ncbi:MAG: MBL fold metallo-hydrolase [Pyrodictiaceae archaeon]
MPRYKLTIVVDNSAPHPTRLLAEYGFALLLEDLELNKIILFDTGATGHTLLHNLELLGVSPQDIDYIVLSHRHYDHTGGLVELLKARRGRPIDVIAHPDLFVPAYSSLGGVLRYIGVPFTREALEGLGARLLLVKKGIKITDNIMTSGEIPRRWGPEHTNGMLRLENGELREDHILDDNALYVKTEKGLFVVTGCGHAGVENIISYGLKLTGQNTLYGIVGGLHLLGASIERLKEITEFLVSKKPKIVAALHCSGPLPQYPLSEKLGRAYVLAGVGSKIEI